MKNKPQDLNGRSLRYAMLLPMVLLIASVVSCCFSYADAKRNIEEDLNDAMLALANEYNEVLTSHDTITALRQMHETTHKPLIYQASDVNFRNPLLKDEAYFTLTLVDKKHTAPKIKGKMIASDSIMLIPERAADCMAIQLQGFADCSMASVFAASDPTLPGILFSLYILSMTGMFVWRRKENEHTAACISDHPLDGVKLTPMQRQFVQMLLDAPERRVDKATLCSTLWGNKSNAEESLYTLVRRTKRAISATDIEIVCNRGDSYELRVIN